MNPRTSNKRQIEEGCTHSNPPCERRTETIFTMHLREIRGPNRELKCEVDLRPDSLRRMTIEWREMSLPQVDKSRLFNISSSMVFLL
ncbi:hypothetical protein TNCV_2755501 [Trichonephila clavipes]|nr:hypothetical protein TNCV_2755501 [Trichonephila clavipes]